ncbi:MAG: mechanosensitive ion channel [Magnetococcales bacterium]|nr:mechanosensitive ion channel [Magnetococcales bacterium]
MRTICFSILALCGLLGLAVCGGSVGWAAASDGQSVTAFTTVWKQENLTSEGVETVIDLLNKEISTIPANVTDESAEGRRRAVLKERVLMLRQLGETLARRVELSRAKPDKGPGEAELDAKIREWEKKSPATLPTNPTQEAFKLLEEKRAERLKEVKTIQDARDHRRQLVQRIPEMILQAKQAQKVAEEERRKLPMPTGKADATKTGLVNLKLDNLDLSQHLSQAQVTVWNAELDYEKEHGVRQDKELELVQRIFDWEEQQVKNYQELLSQLQAKALEAKTGALEKKEKEAEQARTPREKFLAQWEILVAHTQKNSAEWQRLRTDVASVITGQESRIKEETTELGNLNALVKRLGSQGVAAELLKSTFRLMGQRRLELEQVVTPALRERLSAAQARRVEIETRLVNMREQWRLELQALQGASPEGAKPDPQFKEKSARFFDAYRLGLLDEKRILFEINVDERRLELLTAERANVLDSLERFVLSKVFWIQDADPIAWPMVATAWEELVGAERDNSVVRWMERFFSQESQLHLQQALERPLVVIYGVLLFLTLLIGIPLSKRWRRSRDSWQATNGQEDGFVWIWPTLAVVADAGLWAIYCLVAALAVDAAGFPEGVGKVVARILTHLAFFFLFWRLNRGLLGSHGMAVRYYRMPGDLAATLHRAMLVLLVAYPSLLMPWIIFRGAPFDFHALPRLGYTAYEIMVALVLYYLIRDASPLVRYSFWSGGDGNPGVTRQHGILADHWRLISRAALLGILTVVGIDALGYRFGAATITRNGLLTLVTLFVLIGAYRLTLALVARLSREYHWMVSVAPGEDEREHRGRSASSIQRFLRLLFIVGGGWLLASYWGVNRQTLDALNELTLYTTTLADGGVDVISVADMVRFIVTVLVTFWLVHHLSGIFELFLFSRLRIDQGVRYAILTMSRYVVVLIGLPAALSALHVDVGKIAWLAAAISVGIGFGLQEIVANFVSGIILLLERPVRVGDRISVGTVMGEVRRINIRATRVLNQDLQEILIPNRDLITKEVINWTLSSREVRLMIPVGVAYGSDVEQVRALLLDVATKDPLVLRDPAPRVLFMNHGPNALEFQLRVYHVDPDIRATMTDRLNSAINRAFREHGIEIPYPQQVVHIRGQGVGSLDNSIDPSPPILVASTSMSVP